jgi:DMSO/TMAO reductase YedYZ molybdopterin-dependent catalytic subunit
VRGAPIGRRIILGAIGLGGLGILVGARIQSATSRLLLPITLHDPTGLSDLLPAAGRFRIYSVTGSLPHRTDADYRLTVSGLVDHPTTLTLDDIRQRLPQVALTRDVLWAGVPLRDVLAAAGVQTAATGVVFESFDGTYSETLTMAQAQRDDVLVAHTLLGKPLSREHGGPVRLYVAPMYGYKSLKWLSRIELTADVQPGFWEDRGYDVDAWVGRSNGRSDQAT